LPQLDGIADEEDLDEEENKAEEEAKEESGVVDQPEAAGPADAAAEPAQELEPDTSHGTTELQPTEEEQKDTTEDAAPAALDAVSVSWMSACEASDSTTPIFTLNAVNLENIEGGAGVEIVPVVEGGEGELVTFDSVVPAEGQVVAQVNVVELSSGEDLLGRIMNESEIDNGTDEALQGGKLFLFYLFVA
jgi:hypothetical protein